MFNTDEKKLLDGNKSYHCKVVSFVAYFKKQVILTHQWE